MREGERAKVGEREIVLFSQKYEMAGKIHTSRGTSMPIHLFLLQIFTVKYDFYLSVNAHLRWCFNVDV